MKELAQAVRDLREEAARGAEAGTLAEDLGRLVSARYDGIMIRALELAAGEAGAVPGPFALLALGSEGRGEQLLGADQDNALVWEPGGEGNGGYFAALGRGMEDLLLAAGVPACPHGVMVSNPAWNMGLSAWKRDVDNRFAAGDEEALLRLSLLADLRTVAGEGRLSRELRAHLWRRAGEAPIVVKYLAREALRFSPPLGVFHGLVVEKSGEGKGSLDVKKGGVFPICQGAKALALDLGVEETGTLARLRELESRGVLGRTMARAVGGAFGLFQGLRARFQAQAWRAGRPIGNRVWPDQLAQGEREALKAAFKVVEDFQELVFNRFGLWLLT